MFDCRDYLNRTLESVALNDAKDKIDFEFSDGTKLSLGVEGYCCSDSWIEHITIPDNINGAVILELKENLMDDTWDADEWVNTKVYQSTFRTDKGDIVLEYRNSSNGYYGGYLVKLS